MHSNDLSAWRHDHAFDAGSVVTHDRELTPGKVLAWLSQHEEIVHATIEIHHCPDAHIA